MPPKLFIDTDVIISSLISSKGAAFLLLNQIDNVELFSSNISVEEAQAVAERLSLSMERLHRTLTQQFSIVELGEGIDTLKKDFSKYVLDINDAHIVAGATKAGVSFLVSYNTKHFKADTLKNELGIILATPANILQYLRSI